MKLECVDKDTGLFYRDLVVIESELFNLFPCIICHVAHGKVVPGMANTAMTSRERNLYKVHNFHMIWRINDR